MFKPLLFIAILGLVSSQQSITCELCKSTLASMGNALMSNAALRATMARQISDNCDNVPVKSMRSDCRTMYGDHFDDILAAVGKNPNAQPEAMCKQMSYC